MEKDFDGWNEKKKELDKSDRKFLFKQGEVRWCSVGINVADESCGKGSIFGRPVLVLKKLSHKNYIGIPLSRKIKTGTWFIDIKVRGETVSALLHQIRMFSSHRFHNRLTTIDHVDFSRIKRKLKRLLELS